MYPHRIRLRGPWESEPRVGTVRYLRHFGRPGRIDADERIWLTITVAGATAEVKLNDQYLGRHEGANQPFEYEVTELLHPRNHLSVEVTAPNSNAESWGEVALEIRCTAYLRGVQIWMNREDNRNRLHAAGEVVGTCEGPLELYVLLDRANLIYSTVETQPHGCPFHLISDPFSWGMEECSQKHEVRVELVNVATVWYEWEQSIQFQSEVL
ncbi:MAG TPA: hypothetical protein VGY77_02390 [Gemmataceae bacterium]|nr:hypothetical protein [Gemmataceae bacterium]